MTREITDFNEQFKLAQTIAAELQKSHRDRYNQFKISNKQTYFIDGEEIQFKNSFIITDHPHQLVMLGKNSDNKNDHDIYKGVGAFGRVKTGFLASGERVAVKILAKRISSSASNDEQEAETSALTKAGELIGRSQVFYHATQANDFIDIPAVDVRNKEYIIMRYYSGKELYNLLNTDEHSVSLTEMQKLEIAIQAADKLKTIHTNGLVHLDLKPENIIYDLQASKLGIIDYGSAQEIDTHLEELGTVGYMAPEIFFNYLVGLFEIYRKLQQTILDFKDGMSVDEFLKNIEEATFCSHIKLKTLPYRALRNLYLNCGKNEKHFRAQISYIQDKLRSNEQTILLANGHHDVYSLGIILKYDLNLYRQLQNLIDRMLNFSPADRPTMDQVLTELRKYQQSLITIDEKHIDVDAPVAQPASIPSITVVRALYTKRRLSETSRNNLCEAKKGLDHIIDNHLASESLTEFQRDLLNKIKSYLAERQRRIYKGENRGFFGTYSLDQKVAAIRELLDVGVNDLPKTQTALNESKISNDLQGCLTQGKLGSRLRCVR